MESEPKERRYLIRRPKALQYFHNGQLKKAAEKERVAGRFELFFDLLCKLIEASNGIIIADSVQMLPWYTVPSKRRSDLLTNAIRLPTSPSS